MKKFLLITIVNIFFLFTYCTYSQLNIELKRHDDEDKGFYNTISLYSDFETGNSEYKEIVAGYRIDWSSEHLYTFLNTYIKYKESDFTVTSNKANAHLRFVLLNDGFVRPEVFIQKEFDKFIDIKDRNVAGAGARFNLYTSNRDSLTKSKFSFNAGIGFMFEQERFNHPVPETDMIRSTNYLSCLWSVNDWFKIMSGMYFQVDAIRLHDHRVYFDSDIMFKLSDIFSVASSIHYRYDSEPPWTVKFYDFEIVTGINLTF